MKRVASLLSPFIKELGIADGVKLSEIKRDWYVLFQKPLSLHMYPSVLSKGELLLNADSPVWLQELNFFRVEILKKLGPYDVKTVRFRLGRVSADIKPEDRSGATAREKPKEKTLTAEEQAFIQQTVLKINDNALRVAVKTAIEKAVTCRRTKLN
jgi:hypothetical protein